MSTAAADAPIQIDIISDVMCPWCIVSFKQLEMALAQEDIPIAEMLARALEIAMTRNTGGGEFIERRDYPPEIERALDRLDELKAGQ